MVLKNSHRPVSPVRIGNEYLMEDVPEMNGEVSSRSGHMSREEADKRVFSCGRDSVDCCSSSDSTSKEIVDHLHYDPFGVHITPALAAITAWLEDLKVDRGRYERSSNEMACQEGHSLSASWNVIWNNSFKFVPFPCSIHLNQTQITGMESFPSNLQVDENPNTINDQKLNAAHVVSAHGDESSMAPYEAGFRQAGDVGCSKGSASCNVDMRCTEEVEGCFEFEGELKEVTNVILSNLGVKDLLSVERVCRFLSSAVRDNPNFWKTIHIDHPLNQRITDEVLVKLASRAQGNLECLSLVECLKITGDGLRRILESNRRLTKLCVPGCTRLSVECIMSCIRVYNSNNEYGGIKHVRIGGLYGMNHERFQELNSLLGCGGEKKNQRQQQKPRFYIRGKKYLPYDDDRAIDIEMCPRCEEVMLVYDCPCEGCKVKDSCRACALCIERCADCGRCVDDTEFDENFFLELQCWKCLKQLHDKNPDSRGRLSYHFSVRGTNTDAIPV